MASNIVPLVSPTYVDFIVQSYHYFVNNVHFAWSGQYSREKLGQDLSILAAQVNMIDLLVVSTLSVLLTAARHYTTKYIFKPITDWRGIGVREAGKIPESAWKLTFYLTTWTLAAYLIFGREHAQYFRYPERVWQNYSVHAKVDSGIYALYMIELSFYIHSLYTTLLVDQRRKDTTTLMFHHIICILLLAISYSNKSHKSGLLTLFLHDGSDVLLEATKLVRYFKVQHGQVYNRVETFVNVGFACFLLTWISNRLYWFPLKQVYMASIYVEANAIQVPFISLLVGMLWIILLMNYYWFSFALKLLVKVARGQLTELEDNREYKEMDGSQAKVADSVGDIEDDQTHVKAEKGDEDARKFSVDSGVILLGCSGEHGDGNETDKSTDSDNTKVIEEKLTKSAPSSPSVYNLRQRRANDFRAYR